MGNPEKPSKWAIFKLSLLLILILLFAWAVFSPSKKEATPSTTAIVEVNSNREALLRSLTKGVDEVEESRVLIENATVPNNIKGILETDALVCPQYLLPILPPLPKLPSEDVMSTVTKDQLNFILYQHIKEHQERTIDVRQLINNSYTEYLKTCN